MKFELEFFNQAEDLISTRHEALEEILMTIEETPIFWLDNKSEGKEFTVIQQLLNTYIRTMLTTYGWEDELNFNDYGVYSYDKADFFKSFNGLNVLMEVQFGNNARSASDIDKFQRAHAYKIADLAVHVVPTHQLANKIDSGVSEYEVVKTKLEFSPFYQVPTLLIGVDFNDSADIVDLEQLPAWVIAERDPRSIFRGKGNKKRTQGFIDRFIEYQTLNEYIENKDKHKKAV